MGYSIQERIQKVLSLVFISHNGHFPDEWGPNEIEEWDSMNHLNMVMALGEEFDITLEFEEVLAIEKVGDIFLILEKKAAQ